MNNLIIYFLIFMSKILELSIVTLRMILTARDEKLINTLLCFMQSVLLIFSLSTVVNNISEDPFRIIAYVLGCSAGCYLGMVLDEKIAIGQNMLTVIVDSHQGEELVKNIRANGFAVTVIRGSGMNVERLVLMIATKRRNRKKLLGLIQELVPNAMIIYENVNTVGGYL